VASESSFWRELPESSITVGDDVEYTGEDIPELHVWRGHPGRIVDIQWWDPPEASVSLVAGWSMCFPMSDLQRLDDASYRQRGERIIKGEHPLGDRQVGDPLTADGSHWP